MPSRIALSALALRPEGTGVQTYIRELIRALAGTLDAELVVAVQGDVVDLLPAGVTARRFPVAAGARRALTAMRSLGPADLVHGLDAVLPLRVRAPAVVTVHDLAVYDVPGTFSRRRAAGKRLQLRHSIRRADAVISVSEFTAERVRTHFGRTSVVIPEAPPSDCAPPSPDAVTRVRERYALPDRFVLHVGTIEPRKDVATLVAACEQIDAPLVLAGARAPGTTTGSARALGYVPRSDLNALYGSAAVVAYPSRYEGFGLPPLEAMACGAPVVASGAASLPEVLGDAALLVPAGDVDALAAALRDVLEDDGRAAALRAAGLARARSLSWQDAAARTTDVYRGLGLEV